MTQTICMSSTAVQLGKFVLMIWQENCKAALERLFAVWLLCDKMREAGMGTGGSGTARLPFLCCISLEKCRRLTYVKFLMIKQPTDLSNNILFGPFFYEQD